MSSSDDNSMEEILQEDDERDSIEYKILMAYAQRRLSASKYRKLLKNEANVQKSSSLIRRKVKIDRQGYNEGLGRRVVYQGPMQQQSKKQPRRKYWPGYHLPFLCGRGNQEEPPMLSLYPGCAAHFSISEAQSESRQEGNSQNQTSETAVVNHVADQLAKLVTSRSQESPSDVSYQTPFRDLSQEQDESDPTDGSEGKEHDAEISLRRIAFLLRHSGDHLDNEEEIIQKIVSLLKQSGDRLEEKIKKDRVFYEQFTGMLSYTFFERITDLFLENVLADTTSEPEGQVQRVKVAFTMEIATRLTAVDNHPMNLVLGFGLKYLREHFKPWIQDQGGWEKALTSLEEEEVE